MKRKKLETFEELISAKNQGHTIIYDNGITSGVVRRVESNNKCHLIVVKMNYGDGMNNLSEFKFYKSRPNEIYLNSFYYDEPETSKTA